MSQDIEVTLVIENTTGDAPEGIAVRLRVQPRQGDYISHDSEAGESRLYRVIAVVLPSNPDSELQTFDVHVIDEGPHNGALKRVVAQQASALSRTERLLLRNQHEILSRIGKHDEEQNQLAVQVLELGYERYYREHLSIVADAPADPAVGQLVLDVLNMYDALQRYLADKKDETLGAKPFAQFQGFDGNDEAEYLEFATFIFETKKLYAYLRPNGAQDALNSHFWTLSTYRKMVRVWTEVANKGKLNAATGLAVLNAAENG
jgi:uncharacterized protein YfbU (UPF0304 family)